MFTTACNKELAPQTGDTDKIKMSLTASAPADTRTELGADGISVLWQEGDAITVYGEQTSSPYTFTLASGAGESVATFEGEIAADDASAAFYAVYPAVGVRPDSLSRDKIALDKSLGEVQTAVKDGYDPNFAVLTGVISDGKVTFRHGMAYFKLTVSCEGVYSINLKTSNTRFGGRPVYVASSGAASAIESAKDNITLKPASGTFEKGASYYIPVPVKASSLKTLTITYAFDEAGTMTESLSSDKKGSEYLEIGQVYDLGAPSIELNPDPVLSVKVTTVSGVDSQGGEGLTIANAYTVKNCSDSDITVSCDGTVVTSASVSEGSITYSVSANTTDSTREGWIKLALAGSDATTISVTQNAEGAAVSYSWDFGSAEWQAEFAKFGAVNTDIENWNLTYDGLTLVSTAKSKYQFSCFQWGGKGSTSDRYLKFEAPAAGTLTVTASNTGDREDLTRMVTVNQGGVETSLPGGTAYSTGVSVVSFDVQAGEVLIYCTGNALRFYKVEFVPGGNSPAIPSNPDDHVWNFGSAEWQAEFAKMGAANTDIENWNLTYDGLTIVSTQKSKYQPSYFQWGGKGSAEDRYVRFEAPAAGKVSVTSSNTSSGEDAARLVTVCQNGTETSVPGGAPSGSPATVNFDVEAGEVLIYCTGNALRFYRIEYHVN